MTKLRICALCVAWMGILSCRAEAAPTKNSEPPSFSATIPAPVPEPPPLPTDGPSAIYSNTTHVEALVAQGNSLWVATRGGLEEYDIAQRKYRRMYSTRDGLPSLFLDNVTITKHGLVSVTTVHHDCTMHEPSRRFSCTKRQSVRGTARGEVRERIEGVPITARLKSGDGNEWLGTAGLGLWLRSRGTLQRLTPRDQIASNHVVAISEWNGASWFATFDRGLARRHDGRFSEALLGARMLNDVMATNAGLFVATSEGLYTSMDGESFHHDRRVTERSISDLAYDPRKQILYVTATNSLWEIPLAQPRAHPRVMYQPGGSRSLQAVDVSPEGTLFLASEDRGVLRRDGRNRYIGYDRLSGHPSSWATDVLALGGRAALVGSLRHGVYSIDGQSPVTATIDPWILFLGRDEQDPEAVFIGTQGGALLVGAGGSRPLVGLPNPCVHTIARLTSGLWVGTEGGLAVYQ
ncbi:MAG TPA: hypothetical protein VKP30_32040 [Polyangiaceae bacterium]|nr:hypothetical protein [Polyangiaceae bacterium]